MTRRLYLAYGSNLNVSQMRRRCPRARKLETIWLDDAKLVFRGVADLEFSEGSVTPCGLWVISSEDEASLDRYEGVAQGLYEKKMVPLDNGEEALVYLMTSNGISPPSRFYYDTIASGYRDFGIDLAPLKAALQHSYTNKQETTATRNRRAKAIQRGQFVQQPRPAADAMVQDIERVASDIERAPRGEFNKRSSDTQEITYTSSTSTSTSTTTVGRPLEGYNYSDAARRNTKAKGKGGKRVYTEEEIREIADRARKNHRPRNANTGKRQNLADWLADKQNRA